LQDWQDTEFIDTLTDDERNAFFVGATLYAMCWAFSIFRLCNLFLFSTLKVAQSAIQWILDVCMYWMMDLCVPRGLCKTVWQKQ
jgi:hypothetical protein